jgi:2-methylcitrate dehydratase PrpD
MNQAITGEATPGRAASVPAGGGDAAAVLAGHVAAARTLPEASRRAAARLALDTIGAAIAAHDAAGLPGIRRVIEGWGGRPDATVIGTGARVPAHNAALVNSALARAMELDDVHEQALVHATATTVPVALAVA